MSLIPTVRRQSQVDLWVLEFEASLIYRVRSKTARVTHRNPDSAEGGANLRRATPAIKKNATKYKT